MEEPAARLARNESLFRDLNENVKEAAEVYSSLRDDHVFEFFCECSDTGCVDRVELSLTEYERVRADGTRFVVAPGHATAGIEKLVKVDEDHEVVEKAGIAGDVAGHLDPRAM